MNIFKRVVGTIILPLVMFLLMMALCFSNGKMYFGTWKMWQTLIPKIASAAVCAFGIGLQYKEGRFDFSGGATMLLTAIIAGNIAKEHGSNIILMVVLCLVISVAISLFTAVLYVYGRLPIVISTIGSALILEAISCQIYGGQGVNLVADMKLRLFFSYPWVLLPFGLALVIYYGYSYLTVAGRQSELLMHNQQSAVNIGIDENKNVLISYVFSGLLFGLASMIYMCANIHNAAFTSLSTAGELFSNILPVFIGLMLAQYCGDVIGTVMGALTLCLLSYGMTAVFSFEMGSAITTIITGIFILLLNVVYAHSSEWIAAILGVFKEK